MRRRRIAGVVLVGVVLAAAGSEAAVLCRGRAGKLALREQCRRAEQVLDPSQLDISALVGPPGEPGADGPRGLHPLRIVDSAGVELGPIDSFFETSAFVAITHPALTETVRFFVGADGFDHNTGGAISFVTYQVPNCAGVPFVRRPAITVREAQVYGDSAYYDTGPSQSRDMESSETDTGGAPCTGLATPTTRGTCCNNSNFTSDVAPAIRVPLVDLGFVPPFRAVPR